MWDLFTRFIVVFVGAIIGNAIGYYFLKGKIKRDERKVLRTWYTGTLPPEHPSCRCIATPCRPDDCGCET